MDTVKFMSIDSHDYDEPIEMQQALSMLLYSVSEAAKELNDYYELKCPQEIPMIISEDFRDALEAARISMNLLLEKMRTSLDNGTLKYVI